MGMKLTIKGNNSNDPADPFGIKKAMNEQFEIAMRNHVEEKLKPFADEVEKYNIQVNYDQSTKQISVTSDSWPEDVKTKIEQALSQV